MSLYFDEYQKLIRLERENEYLREQVRTAFAELGEKCRADFLLATPGGVSKRTMHETAASRMLITDEAIYASDVDVLSHACLRMKRQIEALAREGEKKPLDYIWRLTLERDYKKEN